jgi:dienelactone hydrolase
MEWISKGTGGHNGHTSEFVDPIVEKAIKYLKEQGYERIGSVGYCFGARYVIRFLAEGKGIDVGFVAHPRYVYFSHSPIPSILFSSLRPLLFSLLHLSFY